MRGSDYAELSAFVAVVDRGNFARAAKHLRVSPSSLSQTVKKLEDRLGVELLHRTTRSVSMTGAGVRLFERFRPAMAEMEAAVDDLHEISAAPSGLVRLHVPGAAYARHLNGRLGELTRSLPRVHLDAVIDDGHIDIIRAGFDLDIRLSAALDATIAAVALGGPIQHVAVASAAYLAEQGIPETPSDLARHRCIKWRRPGTEHAYQWMFEINGCLSPIDVTGPMTVSDCRAAVAAAIDSVGIAFVLEEHAASALAAKRLQRVLTPYLPSFPGWSVCCPQTSRPSAAANAVIRFLVEGHAVEASAAEGCG